MALTPGPDMENDPQLAAIYRAGAEAGPPPQLDDAIRAAARREVGAGPRRSGFRRWQLPLSLAAVLLLSVTVVTQMREQGADRPEALIAPPPAPVPAPSVEARREPAREVSPALPAAKPAAKAPPVAAPVPPSPAVAALSSQMAPPPAAATAGQGAGGESAARAAAEATLVHEDTAAATRRETAAPRPLLRSAPAPLAADRAPGAAAMSAKSAAVPAPEALWQDLLREPAERWIQRIVELRRGGRTADADALTAEFRRRFPDTSLPEAARAP